MRSESVCSSIVQTKSPRDCIYEETMSIKIGDNVHTPKTKAPNPKYYICSSTLVVYAEYLKIVATL